MTAKLVQRCCPLDASEDGDTKVTQLYQAAEGAWRDLDYGVPFELGGLAGEVT